MKTVYLLLSLMFSFSVFAQYSDNKDSTSPYLFPEFMQGKVKLKNGSVVSTFLNYYTISQEVIFEQQQGEHMALAELQTIDTVEIAGRKFIPVKKRFYEVLTNTTVPLLARHYANLIHNGAPTAYGGNSNFASALADISSAGKVYGLKLPDNYTTIPHTDYWLKKDNKYYEANNPKQIINVFPDKEISLREFMKSMNIDVKKQDDLIKVILFCEN